MFINIPENQVFTYNNLYKISNIIYTRCRIVYLIEQNVCKSSPCQHGATCISYGSSYNCICNGTYDGTNCEGEYQITCSLLVNNV